MGRKGNARLVERAFLFVAQAGEQRTDNLQSHLRTTYGNAPRLADMTQTLLYSGLFKRVGWYDRVEDTMMRTSKTSKELGLHSARYICVVDAKSKDEIIDKYLEGKSTLRRLESMPAFVRQMVEEARG